MFLRFLIPNQFIEGKVAVPKAKIDGTQYEIETLPADSDGFFGPPPFRDVTEINNELILGGMGAHFHPPAQRRVKFFELHDLTGFHCQVIVCGQSGANRFAELLPDVFAQKPGSGTFEQAFSLTVYVSETPSRSRAKNASVMFSRMASGSRAARLCRRVPTGFGFIAPV